VKGYQDTFLANVGCIYIANSYIQGAVDFIFGLHASLWMTNCVINVTGPGHITASGRSTDDPYYYVITNSTVTGYAPHKTYLGRPWGDYAQVVLQYCHLGSVVMPAGWSTWNSRDSQCGLFHILLNEITSSTRHISPVPSMLHSPNTQILALEVAERELPFLQNCPNPSPSPPSFVDLHCGLIPTSTSPEAYVFCALKILKVVAMLASFKFQELRDLSSSVLILI